MAGRVRSANPLPAGHRYRAGASLFIPRPALGDINVAQIRDSALLTEPILHRVIVHARARDSLARLGKRYGVAAADLAKWNPVLTSGPLRKGATVVLLLPTVPGWSSLPQNG